MPSFTTVVSMLILVAFAALIDYVVHRINQYVKNKWLTNIIFVGLVVFIVIIRFDIGFLREKHTMANSGNSYTRDLMHNKEVFKSMNLPGNAVLFNVKGRFYIEAMFYTGLPAYNFIPTIEQYRDLKSKGRRVAIIKTSNPVLPAYLVSDPTVIIINKEIAGDD
jgi:4-amino-4-deoxy-L-arabinose transferase